MKRIKRTLAIILSLCLIMQSNVMVKATTTDQMIKNDYLEKMGLENIRILECDDERFVVEEKTDDGITIATNYTTKNILEIEKFDNSGINLIYTDTIDLSGNRQLKKPIMRAFGNGDKYQHTFSNYEYDMWYGNPNKWKVRRPASGDGIYSFTINQNNSNKDNLYNYAEKVEDVNAAEYVLIGLTGVSAAVTIISAVVSGGLAAGIAAGSTGGTTVVPAIANLNSCCHKADLAFDKI